VSCGAQLPAAAKFCVACAYPVGRPHEQHARFGSPDTYTPRYLAEVILGSKASLEGERKQVTVLFADLKGSMELLADRDPEEARQILDPVLEHMMEAVHWYEGTVNQVMGDGIMALFGAPVAHEDHAVRACYAALRMQHAMRRYAEEIRRTRAAVVKIRVGVNSGEVVVRTIGSDLRMDYTAVGHTTHLAARMEQAADPGAIVIAPATLALAEGYVEVKPLGPVSLKGLADAMEVYELTGAGPARTRLQASARRGLTRFIGREMEMEQLRHAQQLALDGHPQVAAIVGDPGVGKSRLLHEFLRSHRLHRWKVLETAVPPYGGRTSYLPVIDLLRSYFKIQDRDSVRDIREKVTGTLLTLDEALKPTLPALLALLGVSTDDPAWAALDPVQRRQRTIDATTRVWSRESQIQPLLLVVEDLHWMDAESQALLDALVESQPQSSLLLLVNYRPDYQHTWEPHVLCSELRLSALPDEDVSELLDALLGRDSTLEPLRQMLIARTGGNPFFLEESVRALRESKALAGEPGDHRLAGPIEALRAPASVQAVLAARIDRLPPDDKRLLQTAAVVGQEVPFALLEAVADLHDDSLRAGLARLRTADFLYETTFFQGPEYRFTHALTHDVAYSSLLHERRRTLHQRILGVMETTSGDQLHVDAERRARHALGGESWLKAATYLRQAGRRATTQSAYQAAAGWLEEALRALGRVPESPETLAEAIDARLDLRIALIPLRRYRDALDLMRETEALAIRLGDQARLGWVLADLCARLRNVLGEHRQAVEVGQRALAIANAQGDHALALEATYRTGQACFALGDYAQAIDLFGQSAASAHERERTNPSSRLFASWSHAWLAMALSNLGRFTEAMSHAREAVRIAETADHPFTLVEALTALGGVSLLKGDLDDAIDVLERGLALSREWKFQPWATLSRLGYAYALSARLPEARRLLDEVARSDTTVSSMGVGQATQVAWLAEACALDQQLDDATQHARAALSLAQEHQERGDEAWAHRVLGEIAARRGDLADVRAAETHYHRALALATELQMRPLVAHCQLGLGTLHRRAGSRDEAHESLTVSATMYREMQMQTWRGHAEMEMRKLK
jgi:class 3 adenylate cyclase/tetratricopeptide (TPR) repeat protein